MEDRKFESVMSKILGRMKQGEYNNIIFIQPEDSPYTNITKEMILSMGYKIIIQSPEEGQVAIHTNIPWHLIESYTKWLISYGKAVIEYSRGNEEIPNILVKETNSEIPAYCRNNAGKCETCPYSGYGKDCMNNPVSRKLQ